MQYESASPGALSVFGTPVALIPWPDTVGMVPGATATFFSGTVIESGDVPDADGFLARELADELSSATGGSWHAARGAWQGVVRLALDEAAAPRSYTLDVRDGGIAITGGDLEGLRYGVQTLRQMLRQCGGVLPIVRIKDAPQYAVRGYYLDVTRGRVPTLDWLKRWACELELCKYNQLHLYIEHSFAFQGLSEAWRGLDPLTAEQIMAFDAFCAERGIELVPSVSTFGHLYAVLRTQGLRHLGEFPEDADRPFSFIERQEHHTLNILLDESFKLSTSMIDQYLPLFRSRKFNIGADETFDLGRGRSHGEAERIGVGRMYARYVNRLCAYLADRGREPMLWGDIVLEHPQALADLDGGATLLNWQYEPDVTDDKVRVLADAGARQYVCPAVQGWNRTLPRLHDAWRNIDGLSAHGIRYGAEGFLLTDWGDYGHINDPRLSLPAMMYGAECSWRGERAGFDEINRRVGSLIFGDTTGAVMEAWDERSRRPAFPWHDAIRLLELDEGDGALNRDVLATFAQLGTPDEHVVSSAGTVAEARRLFLGSMAGRLGAVPSMPRALPLVQRALAKARVRAADRREAGVLALAARGQDLFDACGWWLAVDAGVLERTAGIPDMGSPAELAQDLEYWFEEYRGSWREISRESELDRIGSVVWRLADMLRRIGAGSGDGAPEAA